MNKWSVIQPFNDHPEVEGGWEEGQLPTKCPHALTGGPSVQVQFPHLKIYTLTTATTNTYL